MLGQDIKQVKISGKISDFGREIIRYSLDTPQTDSDLFPNDFFSKISENYIKYLKDTAFREIIPKMRRLSEQNMRLRDIRRECSFPIDASLSWKISCYKEKYLSLRCESLLVYPNSQISFTAQAFTLDTETGTLKNAREFSKKASRHGKNFFISGSKIYTYQSRSKKLIKFSHIPALSDLVSYKITNS